MKRLMIFSWSIVWVLLSCKKDQQTETSQSNNNDSSPYSKIENTYGFNLLKKISGIWAGPLVTTTMIGNFPEWISDLRPISSSQVSEKMN